MFVSREMIEEREAASLAPYGCKSHDSRGREVAETEHEYRTAFQRDRDRILHTTAFRRLEYKTQVFVILEGDYYRTRLTHTLEVAQIGRTLARALGANEDLVEAICLAHDLGHPAFGHAGEATLNHLMAGHGGFDHNRQSLRIVEFLEQRFPAFRGLNLTWEVREGIVKHETEYDVADAARFEPERRGTLETQLANPADEIAYNAHDLDDGLCSGLLSPRDLDGLAWWEWLKKSIGWDGDHFSDLVRHRLIRRLIGTLVTDLIAETARRLDEAGVTCVEDVRALDENIVSFSPDVQRMNRELKGFLYANLYRHPRVMRMQKKAERLLTELFTAYVAEPAQLPKDVQARAAAGEDLYTVICDYIAGMTDRFALQEYARMFDPFERV